MYAYNIYRPILVFYNCACRSYCNTQHVPAEGTAGLALHVMSYGSLGLLLGTEAPVMTPNGIDFSFSILYGSVLSISLMGPAD